MQTLEEYIAKRKKEDGLNEFDNSQKMNNIRSCIDYIFEYFDQYLPIQGAEKRTAAENEKIVRYEKTLSDYTPDVRDWLVSIYETYGKQINRHIANFVDEDEAFPLMYTEAEFRSISYDCYAYLIKKCPFLKNQSEMLYKFIREYHIKETNCNGVQREHNKKLNNGLPILQKVPPKRDYGRYFCIMAEKGGTSHGA